MSFVSFDKAGLLGVALAPEAVKTVRFWVLRIFLPDTSFVVFRTFVICVTVTVAALRLLVCIFFLARCKCKGNFRFTEMMVVVVGGDPPFHPRKLTNQYSSACACALFLGPGASNSEITRYNVISPRFYGELCPVSETTNALFVLFVRHHLELPNGLGATFEFP